MKANPHPTVSVIIPTYNRIQRLKQVLAGLERQHYPLDAVEVIVVADGCSDGTTEYLYTLATALRLLVIACENRGAAAARNRGLRQASGELVVFLDDDVVPTPHLLAEHVYRHRSSTEELVVLGPLLTPPDATLSPQVAWEQAMLMKQYEAMLAGHWQPTPRQFYTGNASVARRHLLAAGGFDESFRRAEDVELAYRLVRQDLRFVLHPAAIGYHYAERSFRTWMDIPYAYGRSDVILTHQRAQSWLLPTIRHEFQQRNHLTRWLVRTCAGHAVLTLGSLVLLTLVASLGQQMQQGHLAQMAYSGIFNLRYYQGIADEMGGRTQFLHWLDEL